MARKVTDTSGSPGAIFTVHMSLGEEFFADTAETVPDIDALRLDSNDGARILAHVLDDSSTLARDWAAGRSPGVGPPATGIVGGTHRAEFGHAAVASVQVGGFPIVASGLYDKSSETLRHTWETIVTGAVVMVLGAASVVLLVLLIRRSSERARLMQSHVRELAEDVEELERRDEKRDLLMREVHHRVKNNLLIISNVIRMIVAGGGPFTADTLRDIESRIAAVQQIHDALYHSADPADLVRMDTYLDSLVEKIMSSVAGPQVWSTVDVEAVELPAREAITLGLLSTEIITNAIKHGVVEGGAIMITGRSHESGFRIRYWNDGRPYRATKPGMGTLLINALVEQLDGTLELDTEDGTCWTLTIDLDHLRR
jgi:two-component sensor histidine kinase